MLHRNGLRLRCHLPPGARAPVLSRSNLRIRYHGRAPVLGRETDGRHGHMRIPPIVPFL